MADRVENVLGSIVQHGPINDRIYVIYLAPGSPDSLISKLDQMARMYGYGKIFAKIPAGYSQKFFSAGFVKEAEIPRLLGGVTDCFFVSKFFKNRQKTNEDFSELYSIAGREHIKPAGYRCIKEKYQAQVCVTADAQELSLLYRQVFKSYPFPIFDPSYLTGIMNENVRYYCIRAGDSIVATAATEVDQHSQYVEMTDFATHPEWRGKGLAENLLRHMGGVAGCSHVKTAFTIARASSYGMNSVFHRCGYTYSGLLINNTNISGRIQSMSVWYKHIR